MYRLLPISLFLFLAATAFSQNTTLTGVVYNSLTEEPEPTVNVLIYEGETFVDGAYSLDDGTYEINGIPYGNYDIIVNSFTASDTLFDVRFDKKEMNINFAFDPTQTIQITVKGHKGLFNIAEPDVVSVRAEDIEVMPVVTVDDLLVTMPNAVETEEGVSFRGSRPNASVTYLDGMRIQGNFSLPLSAVNEFKVYSGGVPARYGDATGSIVVIETKSYFDTF